MRVGKLIAIIELDSDGTIRRIHEGYRSVEPLLHCHPIHVHSGANHRLVFLRELLLLVDLTCWYIASLRFSAGLLGFASGERALQTLGI